MLSELNDLFDMSSENDKEGSRVLSIYEHGASADGSFLLHYFITSLLKADYSVCVLALTQSSTHYNCIASKLSTNLSNFATNGRFVLIEGLKLIGQQLVTEASEQQLSVLPAAHIYSKSTPCISDCDRNTSLRNLFTAVREHVDTISRQSGSVAVLVDDLSILVCLGYTGADVATFARYLHSLILSSTTGRLICAVHCGVEVTTDDDLDIVCTSLRYESDVNVDVRSLPTGYCKDVDGEVESTPVVLLVFYCRFTRSKVNNFFANNFQKYKICLISCTNF